MWRSVGGGVGKCVGVCGGRCGGCGGVERDKGKCGRKCVGFPHASPTSTFTSPTPQHTFPHLP